MKEAILAPGAASAGTGEQRPAGGTVFVQALAGRQLNDPYVAAARRRASPRSAFKLNGAGRQVPSAEARPRGCSIWAPCAGAGARWLLSAWRGGQDRPPPISGDGSRSPESNSCKRSARRRNPAALKRALDGEADLVLSDMASPTRAIAKPITSAPWRCSKRRSSLPKDVLSPAAPRRQGLQGGAASELLRAGGRSARRSEARQAAGQPRGVGGALSRGRGSGAGGRLNLNQSGTIASGAESLSMI